MTSTQYRWGPNCTVQLAPEVDTELRVFWEHFGEDVLGTLQPWGRPRLSTTIDTVGSMGELMSRAEAPVDGLLRAMAGLSTVTLLAPPLWTPPPDTVTLRKVLVHELAHVLLFQRCAPERRRRPVALPSWFREGMAVLASEGAPSITVLRRLPTPDRWAQFAHADAALFATAASVCYDVAHVLFARWYEEFGARSLTELCREMRQGHPFAVAFARVCRLDEGDFVTSQPEGSS